MTKKTRISSSKTDPSLTCRCDSTDVNGLSQSGLWWTRNALNGQAALALGFAIAIVLDIVVIPWPYVLVHYIREPSDRWKQSRLVSRGMT